MSKKVVGEVGKLTNKKRDSSDGFQDWMSI